MGQTKNKSFKRLQLKNKTTKVTYYVKLLGFKKSLLKNILNFNFDDMKLIPRDLKMSLF